MDPQHWFRPLFAVAWIRYNRHYENAVWIRIKLNLWIRIKWLTSNEREQKIKKFHVFLIWIWREPIYLEDPGSKHSKVQSSLFFFYLKINNK
jgi:hypothetical protein